MQHWNLKSLTTFGSSATGASIVEFAIVAPLFIVFVMGLFEVGLVMAAQTMLDGGLGQASRYGITGVELDQAARKATIVEVVNDHSYGLFTIEADDVSTLIYPGFEDIGRPEPYTDENANGNYDDGEDYTDVNCNGTWDSDMGRDGTGAGNEVVLYSVEIEWSLMTSFLNNFFGDDGTFGLRSSVAVRNEPFPGEEEGCS